MRKYQVERNKENEPVRTRLEVADDLLAENREQLVRLLDLSQSSEFPKEALTDRKTRFEKAILPWRRNELDWQPTWRWAS